MQKCETEFRYQVSFQIIRSFLLQFHGKVSLQIRIYCVNDFSDGNFFPFQPPPLWQEFPISSKNCIASFFQLKSEVIQVIFCGCQPAAWPQENVFEVAPSSKRSWLTYAFSEWQVNSSDELYWYMVWFSGIRWEELVIAWSISGKPLQYIPRRTFVVIYQYKFLLYLYTNSKNLFFLAFTLWPKTEKSGNFKDAHDEQVFLKY